MMQNKEIKKEFENEVLGIKRVERMTSGGRRLRFRTLVIVGNKNGKVGMGIAKGSDVQKAIEKATNKAQKNIIEVPILEGTIPHDIKKKCGAATVLLRPQTEGRGLVAGGTVRTICKMAGIKNISGKIVGNTRNKLSNARATLSALQSLKIKNHADSRSKTEE